MSGKSDNIFSDDKILFSSVYLDQISNIFDKSIVRPKIYSKIFCLIISSSVKLKVVIATPG